ncbi:MAG: CZB domain-containing protein [Motiliproteus sp.]|nr:CZB domain-containing protein [Motiliproteus sp.]MCW9052981.1 CZB domain-containing protein [Motiliproteus sp.]
MIFKQNGYIALSTQEKGPEYQAVQVNDQECRLGIWYHQGSGRELFSHTNAYRQLHTPHKAVHYHVQQALLLSEGNWQKNEELRLQIIEQMRGSEEASNEVLECIDQMIAEERN